MSSNARLSEDVESAENTREEEWKTSRLSCGDDTLCSRGGAGALLTTRSERTQSDPVYRGRRKREWGRGGWKRQNEMRNTDCIWDDVAFCILYGQSINSGWVRLCCCKPAVLPHDLHHHSLVTNISFFFSPRVMLESPMWRNMA